MRWEKKATERNLNTTLIKKTERMRLRNDLEDENIYFRWNKLFWSHFEMEKSH